VVWQHDLDCPLGPQLLSLHIATESLEIGKPHLFPVPFHMQTYYVIHTIPGLFEVPSPRYAESSLSKVSRIPFLPQLRLQGYEQTCHTIQASTDKQRMAELNANTSSLWAFGCVCCCNEKVHAC
jgi:hypothetical protein